MSFVAAAGAWITLSFTAYSVIYLTRTARERAQRRQRVAEAELEAAYGRLIAEQARGVILAELERVADEVRTGDAPREWARLILGEGET